MAKRPARRRGTGAKTEATRQAEALRDRAASPPATLVVDLETAEVKYRIVKDIRGRQRQARTAAFLRGVAADPLRALFFGSGGVEPFAALHSLAEDPV